MYSCERACLGGEDAVTTPEREIATHRCGGDLHRLSVPKAGDVDFEPMMRELVVLANTLRRGGRYGPHHFLGQHGYPSLPL